MRNYRQKSACDNDDKEIFSNVKNEMSNFLELFKQNYQFCFNKIKKLS